MESTKSNKERLDICEPPRLLTQSEIDWLRLDARISLAKLQELQAQSKQRPM